MPKCEGPDYWRPFYYLLEDELSVILVNARDARNVPGRKTDVSDAAWLADLGAHGLVRASFVPPRPIRELRDLTRAMLEALIAGQDDPAGLADLARRRMRAKIPELTEALTDRFGEHHRYMAALYLRRIDAHTADINDLSARIEEAIQPFRLARELLVSIPGFSNTVAEVFITETGADMTVFPTDGQFASWAGTAPGANESAGRVKSTGTRPGNRYLKGALGTAALAVSRSQTTYLGAKYRRIKSRRGPMKALVAVEHAMLTAARHMLTTGELYKDPGPDYFIQRAPAAVKARAIGQLEALGYQVTIEPLMEAG